MRGNGRVVIDIQHRLTVIAIIVASLFAALVLRLGYLQTVEAASLKTRADRIPEAHVYIPSIRGRVLDRNGRVLIDNLAINVVRMDTSKMKTVQRIPTITRLSAVLGVPFSTIERRLVAPTNNAFEPAEIARHVKESQILYIEEHIDRFPGVSTAQTWQRVYPNAMLAAHVLGYIGKINQSELDRQPDDLFYNQGSDVIGKTGIEKSFERELRGLPGEELIIKDRLDRVIRRTVIRGPVQGKDVRLTIDVDVQRLAEESFAQGLVAARQNVFADRPNEYIKATSGAIVVTDVTNGEILAMASYPTYDPREFIPSISSERFAELSNSKPSPFINRAIEGQYPPGSTFKLFTALAALKAGLITPDSVYDDTGTFKVDTCQKLVQCVWKNPGRPPTAFGPITLQSALRVSSDTYFYRLGNEFAQLGAKLDNGIQNAAKSMGLGTPTNVQLPGERKGALPDREYRARCHQQYPKLCPNGIWTLGDTVNVAIGQGDILVTPLQLARAYATLANGGSVLDAKIELDVAPRAQMESDAAASVTGSTRPGTAASTGGAGVNTTRPPVIAPTMPRSTVAATTSTTTTKVVSPLDAASPSTTLAPVAAKPRVASNVDIPDDARNALIAGFEDVVGAKGGTASAAFAGFPLDEYPIAGKTGTAQRSKEQDYAVFAAFGPVTAPKYAVSVVMEEGGFGRQAAAVVRRVFDGLAGHPLTDVRVVSGVGGER